MYHVVSLSIGLLLVALIVTMVVVLNPAFAASLLFNNKAECIEYVIHGTKVVRSHALQSVKASKQLAEELCAEF
jgi:hypothetical protein